MERLSDWLARLSALSAWAAAAGMSLVLSWLGQPLAMGAQMYAGNTEPNTPTLPFPWAAVGFGLVLALGLTVRSLRASPARRWGLAAMGLSLATLAVELRWMLRLVDAAG